MQPLRILSLGWGVQSWTLAAMAALGELEPVDYAVHADTTHEASGTYAHAKKWTPWLEERGVKVVTVRPDHAELVQESWGNATMIPAFTTNLEGGDGQIKRQCTHNWKIRPIRQFLRSVLPPQPPAGAVVSIQGISWDEALRVRDSNVAYIVHEYPLVDRRITRKDCILWLERNGLDVPPKSACSFCPYQSLAHWKDMKRAGGSDWERAVWADGYIRDQRPGFRLYIHPYRKPLAEAVAIPEDHGARQLSLVESCDSGYCFT